MKQLVTYFCELHFPLIQELSVVNESGEEGFYLGAVIGELINLKKKKKNIYI